MEIYQTRPMDPIAFQPESQQRPPGFSIGGVCTQVVQNLGWQAWHPKGGIQNSATVAGGMNLYSPWQGLIWQLPEYVFFSQHRCKCDYLFRVCFVSTCGRCVAIWGYIDACYTTISNLLLLLVHNYSNHPLLHFLFQQTICRLRFFGGDVPNGWYEEVQVQYCIWICRKPCRVTT